MTKRFGEIAVGLGLVTQGQVDAALEQQVKLRQRGSQKRIGEIMVGLRYLTTDQARQILNQRKKKAPDGKSALGPGSVLGSYRLIKILGKGAMGVVYKAQDVDLDRMAALKVLSAHNSASSTFIKRFQREVSAAGKLNHPNIVIAYGAGQDMGMPWLAMELIKGSTLAAVLKARPTFSEQEAFYLVKQAALGLQHAHQNGLVHRDVKPANMMVTSEGTLKLMDLGLAKSIAEDEQLTKTGLALGTPHYIAPEQAMGKKDIDQRSDIYSLGIVLYQLITGKVPFSSGSNMAILRQHVSERPRPAKELAPSLSNGAAALLEKMIEKRPEDRPQSCQEVVAAIERLSARPAPATSGSPPPAGAAKRVGAVKKAAARPKKKGPRVRAPRSSSGCMIWIVVGLLFPVLALFI